jgi:hypothetical protein
MSAEYNPDEAGKRGLKPRSIWAANAALEGPLFHGCAGSTGASMRGMGSSCRTGACAGWDCMRRSRALCPRLQAQRRVHGRLRTFGRYDEASRVLHRSGCCRAMSVESGGCGEQHIYAA